MRNTQMYNVTVGNEVVEVTTLKEVKTLLGDNKITTRAIMAGEYAGIVTLSEMKEQSTVDLELKDALHNEEVEQHESEYLAELKEEEPVSEITVDNLPDTVEEFMKQKVEVILVGDAPKTPVVEDKALTNTEEAVEEDTQVLTNEDTQEDIEPTNEDSGKEYPEVGDFDDEKAIKKYIKGLSDAELSEWVDIEGLEYKPNEHQAINRMRMAMAIKGLHFPDTVAKKGSTKKKSKYGDFTTEDLVQMAIDNDIEVRDDKGDMRILRMYTIMALKDAGLLEA